MQEDFLKKTFRDKNIAKRVELLITNNLSWSDANVWHIALGCDENYLLYTGVVLESIISENKEQKIVFHFVTDNISEDSLTKLEWFVKTYKNIEIVVYCINSDIMEKLPQPDHWNLSTYFCSFSPLLLHGKVKKLLYLDSDILCVGSLKELLDVDLQDCFACVVKDGMSTLGRDLQEKTGCAEIKGYFNSGVMLFNVDLYCEQEIFPQFIDVLEKFYDKLSFLDQDAFNILFNGKLVYVEEKFNLQRMNNHTNDVRIVHFAGIRKPWFLNFEYYYFNKWREVYKRTPWRDKELGYKRRIKIPEYRYQAEYFFSNGNYLKGIKSYWQYLKAKFTSKTEFIDI